MSAFDLLSVAIGIVFVYLLLSLICTALYEIIEARLKRRASELVKGIADLLEGSSPERLSWWRSLWDSIWQPVTNRSKLRDATTQLEDAHTVMEEREALLETIRTTISTSHNRSTPPSVPALKKIVTHIESLLPQPNKKIEQQISIKDFYKHAMISSLYNDKYSADDTKNLPSYIPSRNFALALMDLVYRRKNSNRVDTLDIASFRKAVEELPDGHLRKTLLALSDSADGDIEKVRTSIEEWYNGTMDRVAGWYKRKAQAVLFVMGLGLALAVNADTFVMATTLIRDANAREALVAASQAYAQQAQSDDATTADPSSPFASCQRDANSPECRVDRNLQQLRALPLPLGWTSTDLLRLPSPADIGRWLWAWFIKVLGCLCTALAISLGAPFWFDVLNKLMVIRSTVKPREKSRDEASEDRQSDAQRFVFALDQQPSPTPTAPKPTAPKPTAPKRPSSKQPSLTPSPK